jgi:hypothetical protein
VKPTTEEIKIIKRFLEEHMQDGLISQGWIEALTWVLGKEEA